MSDVKLEKTNLPESPPMGQSVLPLVDNMKPRVVTTDKENIEKILEKVEKIYKEFITPTISLTARKCCCLYCGSVKSARIIHEEINLYKKDKYKYFGHNVTPAVCVVCGAKQFITAEEQSGSAYFIYIPFDYFTQKEQNAIKVLKEDKPVLENSEKVKHGKPGRPSKIKKEEKEG